jgi:cytidylate kinase
MMAIITVSRGTFSGGQRLAECVAGKLGYRCIPRIALHEAAKRYGVSDEELSKAISETPKFLERLSSERARYLACVRAALVREVKDNNAVYHGLAGHFLLQGVPAVLRVRVIANTEFRVKNAMERNNRMTRKEALDYIKAIDEKRVKWTKLLYHADLNDPHLFDLIINLDNISIDSACGIVCCTVAQKEFDTTPNWRKTMDDLVLSTEVKAIITTSKGIGDSGLEVEADAGAVTLGGTVNSLQDADKIREIVRVIPGVKSIDSKMQIKSTW